MSSGRRDFLKTAGLGGVLAAAPALLAANHARAGKDAPKQARAGDLTDLPKKLSLCTLQRGGEWGLGVKTERGVLDIEAASDHFDIDDVPETVDDLLREGGLRERQREQGPESNRRRYEPERSVRPPSAHRYSSLGVGFRVPHQ